MRWAPALLAGLSLLTGCTATFELGGAPESHAPLCPARHTPVNDGLILVAQAVPTASQLPCVRSVPAGYRLGTLTARNGHAQYALRSVADQQNAVTVTLTRTCSGSAQSPHGLADADDVTVSFSGGCVTYHLDARHVTGARTRKEIADALALVHRQVIAAAVRTATHGHVPLDATTTKAAP